MKLNFTLTSNQGVVNFSLDEPDETSIQEIKRKIVGETIESVGYDKIKLFQSGHHLEDSNSISSLNSNPILVFPTTNSLRPIIVDRFSKKEQEMVKEDITDDENEKVVKEKLIEEKVTLVSISKEELEKENFKVLEKFKQPVFKTLLHLYLTKSEEFTDFLKYLSGGTINTVSSMKEDYEPHPDLIKQMKEIFTSFKDIPEEKLSSELKRMHGNLNLLLTYQLST